VNLEGGLGVISSVGTGIYRDRVYQREFLREGKRPYEAETFYLI